MAFRLYDLPEMEPSRFVGFAGNRIERLSEKRPMILLSRRWNFLKHG